MARDRIKSRASLKGEDWTGRPKSLALGEAKASWPCLLVVELKSSDLESRDESGSPVIKGIRFASGLADDAVSSGSPVVSSMIAESPAGSKLPSPDPVICSGSKARAVVGAANPSKIKSP